MNLIFAISDSSSLGICPSPLQSPQRFSPTKKNPRGLPRSKGIGPTFLSEQTPLFLSSVFFFFFFPFFCLSTDGRQEARRFDSSFLTHGGGGGNWNATLTQTHHQSFVFFSECTLTLAHENCSRSFSTLPFTFTLCLLFTIIITIIIISFKSYRIEKTRLSKRSIHTHPYTYIYMYTAHILC